MMALLIVALLCPVIVHATTEDQSAKVLLATAEPRLLSATTGWAGRRDLPVSIPRNVVPGIHRERAYLWASFSAGCMIEAYRQSQASWGSSTGHFHFKSDWTGDGLALSDETSHLFAAYQLSRIINGGYQWVGLNPDRARRAAFVEAWLLTFLVEFPIDAYNPGQGLGLSDLMFNTVGSLAAYHHAKPNSRPIWDLKVSVKRSFFDGQGRVIAYTNRQYDDYVYWLTLRPLRNRHIPILLGAGYSTAHSDSPGITKELHLGVGLSAEELGAIFGERTARHLRPLNFFFLNWGTKISWR
ncbi:MAG: DUF2279 domain-containing protein [candidate division Zixibacteria bacterium]|nr:DUF2279 domain-containing protein [candidate division Zixibacteria bacterium]